MNDVESERCVVCDGECGSEAADAARSMSVPPRCAACLAAAFELPPTPPPAQADGEPVELDHADLLKAAPPVGEAFADALAKMRRRASGLDQPIPTPWARVNEGLGGGLWPGMYVVAGATGEGKSQFALQVALEAADKGVPTLYVGLELDRAQMVARLAALMLAEKGRPVRWSDLALGKDPHGIEAVAALAKDFEALPIRLEEGPTLGWDYRCLAGRVAALRHENRAAQDLPMLVVLDYLQLVSSPTGSREDLRERIGNAARVARGVAREHNAVVLLLSSVSRENAKRTVAGEGKDDLKPGETHPSELVGLGKESGEIEFSADGVLTLCRGERLVHHTEMHLALAKMRTGPPSWQRLNFNGGRFWEPTDSELKQADAAPTRGGKPAARANDASLEARAAARPS